MEPYVCHLDIDVYPHKAVSETPVVIVSAKTAGGAVLFFDGND